MRGIRRRALGGGADPATSDCAGGRRFGRPLSPLPLPPPLFLYLSPSLPVPLSPFLIFLLLLFPSCLPPSLAISPLSFHHVSFFHFFCIIRKYAIFLLSLTFFFLSFLCLLLSLFPPPPPLRCASSHSLVLFFCFGVPFGRHFAIGLSVHCLSLCLFFIITIFFFLFFFVNSRLFHFLFYICSFRLLGFSFSLLSVRFFFGFCLFLLKF